MGCDAYEMMGERFQGCDNVCEEFLYGNGGRSEAPIVIQWGIQLASI